MLLTDKELCNKIKVTRPTLLAWRKKGMPFIKVNKSVRFEYDKVLEWMLKKN